VLAPCLSLASPASSIVVVCWSTVAVCCAALLHCCCVVSSRPCVGGGPSPSFRLPPAFRCLLLLPWPWPHAICVKHLRLLLPSVSFRISHPLARVVPSPPLLSLASLASAAVPSSLLSQCRVVLFHGSAALASSAPSPPSAPLSCLCFAAVTVCWLCCCVHWCAAVVATVVVWVTELCWAVVKPPRLGSGGVGQCLLLASPLLLPLLRS
jgi:hypothetical protein